MFPEGRQVFPSLTVMENLEMGAMTEAGHRDWKRNIERIFEWLPLLAERREPVRGNIVGRTAADAGDRPGLGVVAKTSDAG